MKHPLDYKYIAKFLTWLRRRLRLKSPSIVLIEEGPEGLARFYEDLARQGYSLYTRAEMRERIKNNRP